MLIDAGLEAHGQPCSHSVFVCLLKGFIVYIEKNNDLAKAGVYFRFLCCIWVKEYLEHYTLLKIGIKSEIVAN